MTEAADLSRGGRFRSLVAVTAAMALVAMSFGFSWPMFSTRLAAMGTPEDLIGLNSAAHASGIFVVAWFAPRLITRLGPVRLMLAMAVAMLVAVLLCIVFPSYWPWLVLRFVIGSAASILWIAGETWINELAEEENRGRVMAIFSIALGVGTVIGILIIRFVGFEGDLPFLALAAMIAATLVPLLAALDVAPKLELGDHRPGLHAVFASLRGAPLAMLLCAAFASVFASVQSFMTVYGLRVGMSVDLAVDFLIFFNLGSIVLPYAAGWLADRIDRALLAALLLALCTVLFAAMGWVLGIAGLDYAYVFVVGGILLSVYSVAMVLLGERFRGAALASAAAIFTLMHNVGAVIGPVVVGEAMERFGPGSMPWTLAVLSVLVLPLALGAWWRRRRAQS